jgi:hypothetical protein
MPPGEQLFFYARPEGGPLAAVVMTLNGVFFPSQIRWCLEAVSEPVICDVLRPVPVGGSG